MYIVMGDDGYIAATSPNPFCMSIGTELREGIWMNLPDGFDESWHNCYRLVNGAFVFDEEKKAAIEKRPPPVDYTAFLAGLMEGYGND